MVLFMWALGSITVTSPVGQAPKDLDELSFRFRSWFHKDNVLGIGRAQGAVEGVEIIAFPEDTALAHPFAARDGLGGLSEIATRLDRHDEAMEDFRCCRVFAWLHGVPLVDGEVKKSRALGVAGWVGKLAIRPRAAAHRACAAWREL